MSVSLQVSKANRQGQCFSRMQHRRTLFLLFFFFNVHLSCLVLTLITQYVSFCSSEKKMYFFKALLASCPSLSWVFLAFSSHTFNSLNGLLNEVKQGQNILTGTWREICTKRSYVLYCLGFTLKMHYAFLLFKGIVDTKSKFYSFATYPYVNIGSDIFSLSSGLLWTNKNSCKETSVYMLLEVAAYRLPQRLRHRAACVKLFQTLQHIRNKKILEDFNTEEECWLKTWCYHCHFESNLNCHIFWALGWHQMANMETS